jgi:glycosyltransferase involved in cell wall biosynthesis
MSHEPRVSVCIPSYNHAPYLPAAIESVLAQTYTDFELIIVDDGSTDDSLRIAASYAARHPERVRVHTHPGGGNRGISETVNLAYSLTRGEFWMGLPSDDVLYPDKLARQVACLDAHPSVGWVYSYGDWMDEAGRPLPEKGRFGSDVTRDARPLHLLIERNLIPGMTVLMRRSCTERVGLHEPALVYSDWEFWLRMLSQCRPAFIPHPLIRCRLHSYNTSGGIGVRENMRRGREVMRSIRGKAAHVGGELNEPRSLALLDLQLAYYSFCLGDAAEAAGRLREVFADDPALARDTPFFARWLRRRVFEVYHTFQAGAPEAGFAAWVAANLPPAAGRGLQRRAAAAQFAAEALTARAANPRAALRPALGCFAADPGWLADASLRLTALEGLLGAGLVGRVRRLKSHLHGRA